MKNLFLFLLLASFAAPALAQNTRIPVGQQGADMQDLQIPRRGITKGAVEETFGSPLMKSNAVGDPPISYWEYDHYLVYFEYDRVLHTVIKKEIAGG